MAVAQTDSTKKGVGDPSAEYESLKPIWDRNRAVCSGERYVKDYDDVIDITGFGNLLIPFSPSMSQQQFNFFKAEAELPGIVAQFAKMLVGGLLRKPPVLTIPEGLPEQAKNWILNEFGSDDAPLSAFLDEGLWEELQTSRAWIYVNYPRVENAEDLTREEREAIKPYPSILPAETVINVRVSTSPDGKTMIKHAIIRGYVDRYLEEEYHPTPIETCWVHEIGPDGFYRITTYEVPADSVKKVVSGHTQYNNDKNSPTFVLKDVNDNILLNGERMKFIPLWPLGGNLQGTEPLLTPIIDKEVSLYNKISRRNHLLYGAATYTPVIMSNMTDDAFQEIVRAGLGSWIHLNEDDKADVLATPTDALQDMDRAIAAGIEEMARLGIRMLAPESDQSGVALELRNAAQTAQLGSLNIKVSNTMRQVIALMLEWRYGVPVPIGEIEFTLSADFNPLPLGADWLRLATEWYREGLIPRTVWLAILSQNDMIPADYDDEEGQLEINGDELIVPSAEVTRKSFEE